MKKTIIMLLLLFFTFAFLRFTFHAEPAGEAIRSGLNDFTGFEIYPGEFWQKQSIIYHQNNFSESAKALIK